MNKDIAYLVQTPDYIPDFVKIIEDMGRDVYILSWKKPLEHKNNIFLPDSTVWEGRNKQAEMVPKEYLYYVFLDEDVELHIRDERYPEEVGKNPWKIFEDFLLEYEPAIGTAIYIWPIFEEQEIIELYVDDTKDANTIKIHDPIISAIHKDALKLFSPLYTGFDETGWWWTTMLYLEHVALAFKSCVLQCNKIILQNKLHRWTGKYTKRKPRQFFHKLYKSSLLYEKDKERARLIGVPFWVHSLDGRYKKPYPGKYKEMVEDFKNRINKNHIIWKDHPLLNE